MVFMYACMQNGQSLALGGYNEESEIERSLEEIERSLAAPPLDSEEIERLKEPGNGQSLTSDIIR
jgi:hypothetical protein